MSVVDCKRTVERPNGKLYRPRKPPAAEEFMSGSSGEMAVIVRFTHDIDPARELAMPLLHEYGLEGVAPVLVWWRVVPWDTSGGDGWAFSYVPDAKHGTPCVVWDR